SSSPSILTRRSIASLIDSSRPLCTLTTYHFLLLGAAGSSGFVSGAGSLSDASGGAGSGASGGALASSGFVAGAVSGGGTGGSAGAWASSVGCSSDMIVTPCSLLGITNPSLVWRRVSVCRRYSTHASP